MASVHQWRCDITKLGLGRICVGLYEEDDDGQVSFVDAEEFGPFDTALDITQWLTRHWAPRARLPLR